MVAYSLPIVGVVAAADAEAAEVAEAADAASAADVALRRVQHVRVVVHRGAAAAYARQVSVFQKNLRNKKQCRRSLLRA